MDKRMILAAATLLLIGGVALGLVVGVVASDSGSSTGTGSVPHSITVTGSATASAAPDLAVMRIGVRAEADTSEAAFAAGGEKADAVTQAIIGAGVDEKDIQTQNLSLNKRTINRDTPQEHTFFSAEQSFEVKVRDVNNAGKVAGAAVGAGATVVGGIEFQLSDKTTSREQALTDAIEGARSKAEVMAAAAGATVGDVLIIDETNSVTRPVQERVLDQALLGTAANASIWAPVSPGEVDTAVDVTVVFELKPA